MLRLLLPVLLTLAPGPSLHTFDACWNLVRRHFYDRSLHGVDWDAVREKYRDEAARASGPGLRKVLHKMLGELEASHAAVLDMEVYAGLRAELMNERYWTFGLVLEESRPGELFVRTQYEDAPAGLLPGDRVLQLNGVDVWKSPHLMTAGYDPAPGKKRLFFLRARKGRKLRLGVQRTPDPRSWREVALAARLTNGIDAARASVRVVRRGPYRIGTLHLWYCQKGALDVLGSAVTGKLKDCDGLVLDIRGRGGWSGIPDGIVDVCTRWWRRPVVFLIDARTRSAKEMLAYYVRRDKVGWLVGERTEGAVLGAGFFPLPDGSVLELPIADVKIGDVRLEGRGVAPHFEARVSVPYAAGRDAVFETGVRIVAREIAARRGWATVRAGAFR